MVGELPCLEGSLVAFGGVPLFLCTYGFLSSRNFYLEEISFLKEFLSRNVLGKTL